MTDNSHALASLSLAAVAGGERPENSPSRSLSRKRHRRSAPPLPPPRHSARLLIHLPPTQTGMFRFLLEAYDNLAYFSVLQRHDALLKLVFSPHQERTVRAALADIAQHIPLDIQEWPLSI